MLPQDESVGPVNRVSYNMRCISVRPALFWQRRCDKYAKQTLEVDRQNRVSSIAKPFAAVEVYVLSETISPWF